MESLRAKRSAWPLQKGRVAAALAVSSLIALLIGPGSAHAARGLVTGFSDPLYQSSDPGERALWLDRTVASGAGLVRINLHWSTIAPSPPSDPTNPASAAYRFAAIDAGVRDARARGLTVMLTMLSAPPWAEGPGRPVSAPPGSWEPSPSAFSSFAHAVAARYSGGFDPDGPGAAPALPAVQALQIWNEPNLPEFLTPQYEGQTTVSPDHYREMLNAAYAAIKAVDPSTLVVTGGTAPYGDDPGGNRVRPVAFDRQLLCVRPRGKKKRKKRRASGPVLISAGCSARATFDVLAHHPINTSGAPTRAAVSPDDASTADLGRITRVLRAAERVGTVSPGHHPLWATEMWWDSRPPNPVGAPLGRQARWIEQSLFLFWKAGASAVVNLLIRDAAVTPPSLLNGGQSGIYFADGRPKPALRAYRFPFVTERLGRGTIRAWGKAPVGGRLSIQRGRGRRWVTARRIQVRTRGVFSTKLRLRGRLRLRARVAGEESLVWRQR